MGRKDRNSQQKPLRIVESEDKAYQDAYQQSQAEATEEAKPVKRQISFDDWWATAEYYYKLKPELREAIKKHFEARGFLASGEFDNGIKDFGI